MDVIYFENRWNDHSCITSSAISQPDQCRLSYGFLLSKRLFQSPRWLVWLTRAQENCATIEVDKACRPLLAYSATVLFSHAQPITASCFIVDLAFQPSSATPVVATPAIVPPSTVPAPTSSKQISIAVAPQVGQSPSILAPLSTPEASGFPLSAASSYGYQILRTIPTGAPSVATLDATN